MIPHPFWLVRIACGVLLILHVALGDQEGVEPRIRNGDDALPTDPGGNIAVSIDGCTASVVNNEWLITAGHCIDDTFPGDFVSFFYTDTSFGYYHYTTVKEIFLNPEHVDYETFLANSLLGSFPFWKYAAHDFGMLRLSTPLPATCEDGPTCNQDNPNIPMNVPMVYSLASPGILQSIANFLSFGLFSWLFGDPGFFNRDQFHQFGYGSVDQEYNDPAYRKAVIPNTFSASYEGGQYWSSFFRDSLLFSDDPRQCPGDSGSGWLMRGDNDMFALAGVTSGGVPCNWLAGVAYSYRLDFETADWIQSNVESSGGNCTREDLNGDQILQCFNSL